MKHTIRLRKYRQENRVNWFSVIHANFKKLALLLTAATAVLIVSGGWITMKVARTNQLYVLTNQEKVVIEEVHEKLRRKLEYDGQKKEFVFNGENLTDTSNLPEELKAQISSTNSENQLYSATVARNSEDGIKIYDTQLGIEFQMKPKFKTNAGRLNERGNIIFPIKEVDGDLVYSVQPSGVKEDILLSKPGTDEMQFEYELVLPDTLQARQNEDGSIGIYSADASYYGKISYGSDQDRQKIENARENNEKTNLVFTIPKPVIYETASIGGASIQSTKAQARYYLEGTTLKVIAEDLNKLNYPISIDPSLTVTSTQDFVTANYDDNNFSSSDNLTRDSISGGSVVDYAATTDGTNIARQDFCTFTYSGYLYVIGGTSDNNSVEYAPIDSDGDIDNEGSGTPFTADGDLPVNRYLHECTVYNGYVYLSGGYSGGTQSAVYYAKLKASGGVDSDGWATTSSMGTARLGHKSGAYNGYIYVWGGGSSTTVSINDVEYAPIKADGTLGTWLGAGNDMIYSRQQFSGGIYNGYIYAAAGMYYNLGYRARKTVEYAKIKSDGSVDTWVSEEDSLAYYRRQHVGYIEDGYIVVAGGSGGTGSEADGSTLGNYEYASLNADGSVGSWSTVSDTQASIVRGDAANYNSYSYFAGNTAATTTVIYSGIKPPGMINSFGATTGTFTTARRRHASVIYNDCIYVIGGEDGSSKKEDIQYQTIGATGNIAGSWTSETYNLDYINDATNDNDLSIAGHAAVAYNGFLYVIGGDTGSLRNEVDYIPINANCSLDGTTGWASATGTLPDAVDDFDVDVYGDRIYYAGGDDGGVRDDIVFSSAISTSGDISSWTERDTDANNLATARKDNAVVAYNGYLYAIGGNDGSSQEDTVEYAAISSDGTIADSAIWSTTTALSAGREDLDAFAYQGHMYITGGSTSGGYQNDSEYAEINPNGTIDSWADTATFTTAREDHVSLAYKGYVYIIGGYSGSYQTSIQYGYKLSGNQGSIDDWDTANTYDTNGRKHHSVSVYNGYIYVIGGHDGTSQLSTIRFASINTSGTVGTWASTTTAMPEAREGHASVIDNGYLYVIGGYSGTSYLNTVKYIQLSSSTGDTTGSFTADSDTFTTGRRDHTADIAGGYLYIVGGDSDGSTATSSVQYATINGGSGVGSFSAGNALGTARRNHVSGVMNGYLYIMGGYSTSSSNELATVEYASVGSGAPGSWKYTTNLPEPRSESSGIAYNGHLFVFGGLDVSASVQNDSFTAAVLTDGAIEQWRPGGQTLANSPAQSAAGVSNGTLFVVGGWDNSSSYYNTTSYSRGITVPRRPIFSKLFPIISNAYIEDITYNGTLLGIESIDITHVTSCTTTIDYENDTTTITDTSASTDYAVDVAGKYVFITLRLDYTNGPTYPFDSSTINDVSLSFILAPPSPDEFMRHGKWFEEDVNLRPIPADAEQPFDTANNGTTFCS